MTFLTTAIQSPIVTLAVAMLVSWAVLDIALSALHRYTHQEDSMASMRRRDSSSRVLGIHPMTRVHQLHGTRYK